MTFVEGLIDKELFFKQLSKSLPPSKILMNVLNFLSFQIIPYSF